MSLPAAVTLSLLQATLLVALANAGCPMLPTPAQTSAQRSPGDGGFKIMSSGRNDKYKPNTVYTIGIRGSLEDETVPPFRRFTLSVDSQHDPASPITKVGSLQLFGNSLTAFNEDCVNTVSEASDVEKSEIQVMWRSPPEGSGCVVFTAMVFVDRRTWYAEDGGLVRTFCESRPEENEDPATTCCACDEAKYSLVMEGIWSNVTHPKDFPFSAWLTHFSDLIGASHEPSFSFWGHGTVATDGFRQLAEWGSASGVEAELRANSKYLRTLVKAAGLWYPNVNTNTTTSFRVDKKHPLLSVASMLGPSPDWVVGVSKFNLCQRDCTWMNRATIDLYPWDAGTDNGISYMSPNSETQPREKMKPITTIYPEDPRSPFYDPTGRPMLPLARLYLNREKVIQHSCDEDSLKQQLAEFEVAENTEDTSRPECQTSAYTAFSPCSVSCGKGLRMRTRAYSMPEKAKMLGCNRQLVSKEMCVAAVAECPGEEENSQDLDEVALNRNDDGVCRTTEWDNWSECSSNCGIGFRMRTRRFYDRMGRKKCPQVSLVEKEKCMGPPCGAGDVETVDPSCKVTEWTDWSPCSASCGKGVKLRTRLLMVDPSRQEECATRVELLQQRSCLVQADCTFDMATAKVVCMEEADVGPCRGYFQRWAFDPRKLMCVSFVYGGCRGNRNNFLTSEECSSTCGIVRVALTGQTLPDPAGLQNRIEPPRPAPVDCMVTEWSPWTPCNVSCGPGRLTSFRMIKRHPENGGRPCPRKLQRKARCMLAPCE
ncbi:spondin-1 [Venturia canescens]|uniref:spondin-1 n=1 Tax=Venturia canescens TaxID=32260 RepID=UPI001C9C31BA|nr:spondin-1 [Venturia canescens]XP_043286182.1 spondin-1 [Venturia canescens]